MKDLPDFGPTRRSFLMSACLLPLVRILGSTVARAAGHRDYPAQPVPLTQVDLTDRFWSPRMEVNRRVSIWHCFERQKVHTEDFNTPRLIEGAAYMIAKRPDPKLEAYCDQRIDELCGAVLGRLSHPEAAVRVSGHFLEAAAAYYATTGKRKLLDVALRDIDAIDANFGPGKRTYISGHEGQKIGLVRLYRQTDDERCLQLAKFFLDERGKDNYPRTGVYLQDRTYAQDHAPVVKQHEAVGHCVRAAYLYIALADIAALTGEGEYANACERIWEDAIYRRTYLTGSIGSLRFHEQFGAPYELPNLSAWNETCAAYGNAVWNHRMFLLHRDARYIDGMERILYNGFADGVSLKGDRFYYQNPLKSFGDYERFDWINVPCCPPNVVRLTASIGSYIYAQSGSSIYVNLFVDSKAKIDLPGGNFVALCQKTDYPWKGEIRIQVAPWKPETFAIHVRIPGWAQNEVMPGGLYRYADRNDEQPRVSVNRQAIDLKPELGYAVIERKWKSGDEIRVELPMPVRRVYARPEALEDRDMVALERGPIVYCAEWPDNGGHALNLFVPDHAHFKEEWRGDLLNGVSVVTGDVKALRRGVDGSFETRTHKLTAIPYHAWANRGMGEMAVWLPRNSEKAWINPSAPDPIARVSSSGGVPKVWTGYNDQNSDIGALYDGKDPIRSADESYRYFKMRPPVGTRAWIEYELKSPTRLSQTRVYWFDDRRFCQLPESWRVLYQDGEQWKPVKNAQPYQVVKDEFSAIDFDPVTTAAIRIEIEPATKLYRKGEIGPPDAMFITQDTYWREFGLLEWRIA